MKDSLDKIIIKYFKEWSADRKLILNSSSLMGSEKDVTDYFGKMVQLDHSFNIIKSDNFMNKKLLLKDITISKFDSEDGRFEKRFKILMKLITPSITNRRRQTIICCSEANINLIKAQFNSKKLRYTLITNCKMI